MMLDLLAWFTPVILIIIGAYTYANATREVRTMPDRRAWSGRAGGFRVIGLALMLFGVVIATVTLLGVGG